MLINIYSNTLRKYRIIYLFIYFVILVGSFVDPKIESISF